MFKLLFNSIKKILSAQEKYFSESTKHELGSLGRKSTHFPWLKSAMSIRIDWTAQYLITKINSNISRNSDFPSDIIWTSITADLIPLSVCLSINKLCVNNFSVIALLGNITTVNLIIVGRNGLEAVMRTRVRNLPISILFFHRHDILNFYTFT